MSNEETVRVSDDGIFQESNIKRPRRKGKDDPRSSGRLRERSRMLLNCSHHAGPSRVSVER
jgi:hypothetical protein